MSHHFKIDYPKNEDIMDRKEFTVDITYDRNAAVISGPMARCPGVYSKLLKKSISICDNGVVHKEKYFEMMAMAETAIKDYYSDLTEDSVYNQITGSSAFDLKRNMKHYYPKCWICYSIRVRTTKDSNIIWIDAIVDLVNETIRVRFF